MNILLDIIEGGKNLFSPSRQEPSEAERNARIQFIMDEARRVFEPVVEMHAINTPPDDGRSYRFLIDHVVSDTFSLFRETDCVQVTIGHFNDEEAKAFLFFRSVFASFPLVYQDHIRPTDVWKRGVVVTIPVDYPPRDKLAFRVSDDPDLASRFYRSSTKAIKFINEKFMRLAERDASLRSRRPDDDSGHVSVAGPKDLSLK